MNSMEYAVQSAAIDRLFSLPESFFQQSTSVADFIEDVNNILEDDTKKLNYLYRLEE